MSGDDQASGEVFGAPALGSPEKSVGFVLWRVAHRYVRALDRALAPLDLTHLQFTILALAAWLGRSSDAVTQTRLARFGGIHPMQVSAVLKALEAKGLIERLANPRDTRSKVIGVTDAGRHALKRAFPIAVDVQADLFGDAGLPGGVLLTELAKIDRPD